MYTSPSHRIASRFELYSSGTSLCVLSEARLDVQGVQTSLRSSYGASLFSNPSNVRSRYLIEGGHVEVEASRETTLIRLERAGLGQYLYQEDWE
jgi:hypothetical protein